MSIHEKLYFIRQLGQGFDRIGAVIPTSRYAARAMSSECLRRPGPRTLLEAGAGTGAITAQIVRQLGPDDRLIVCEINPDFVAYLRQRFEREPDFQRVRDQVTLHASSVTEIQGQAEFDGIISAIPFTSCPPELTRAILEHYRTLLKPGGTLTYIEYAYLRWIKQHIATGAARDRAQAVQHLLDHYIQSYQFRRDLVWLNVPPAWIRHLRFTEAPVAEAVTLLPLDHTRRVAVGDLGLASDALVPVITLSTLGHLFRQRNPGLAKLLLLCATLLIWFFRDPGRQIILDPTVAYAASDGRVIAVEYVRDPRLGDTEWLRIAVFLSLTDVHINRTPIAGKVVKVFDVQGGFAAANVPAAEHNLARYMVLEGIHGPCVVVQRAGLVARRIVSWVEPGQLLAQGERYGLIRFGSRTDIYLPANQAQAAVTPGDRVQGGMTVLARYVDAAI